MTIADTIAAALLAALGQLTAADLASPAVRDLAARAAANNAATALRGAPVAVLAELVDHTGASMHAFRAGGRAAVWFTAADEHDAAALAALLGMPEPEPKASNGHEWVVSIAVIDGVEVDVMSEHRPVCVCKSERAA